ncbi:D-alanine--D-alanine ligase family protein [Actinomycetes bacterium KLBMP 9759]
MPEPRTTVAVVFGGRSGEHPVSCLSAASILAHLDRSRFTAVPVRIERDGGWSIGVDDPEAYTDGGAKTVEALDRRMVLRAGGATVSESLLGGIELLRGCDVVFPAIHGPFGEDGTLQSCVAAAGVPFVGSGVLSSALAMDKVRTKHVLAAEGLTVADGMVLTERAPDMPASARERLGLPAFVKPSRSGSSLGVTRIDDWAQLPAAVAHAREYDTTVLVEAAVPGREIDIGVLEWPDATLTPSPPMEIVVAGGGVFDFNAKYHDPSTGFVVPADIPSDVRRRMGELAVLAFEALGCNGLLRVDFFLRPDGELVVNEVNTFPGFTAGSQYPRMWAAAGMDYTTLLSTLLDTALARVSVDDAMAVESAPRQP